MDGWCWIGSRSWRERIEWGGVFFFSWLTLVIDRGHLVMMAVGTFYLGMVDGVENLWIWWDEGRSRIGE